MPSKETNYIVLAGAISLDGAVYEQGEVLTPIQLGGRARRLVQMGVIRPIPASEAPEEAGAKEV